MNRKIFACIISFLLLIALTIPAVAVEEIETEPEVILFAAPNDGEVILEAPESEAIDEEIPVNEFIPENEFVTEYEFVPDYDVRFYDGIEPEGEYENYTAPVKETKAFSIVRLIVALIIGFLIAFIIMKIVAAPLKSVKSKSDANEYETNKIELTYQNDRFLYRNTQRTPIPKQAPPQKK